MAVLVNDFGSINIDAELVVGVESDVISLANGCICCTIREDLAATGDWRRSTVPSGRNTSCSKPAAWPSRPASG